MKKQLTQIVSSTSPPASTVLSEAETAWGEVNQIRKGAIRLHVWLVTIFSFIQPYAIGWFDESDELPKDAGGFYLAVFKITAPLTIGLALWTILLVATWRESGDGGYIMLLGLIGGLILTVSAEIGNALGARRVEILEQFGSLGPLTGFINALYSYLIAYRGALFLSSCGIAGYVGYIFSRYYFAATKLVTTPVTESAVSEVQPKDLETPGRKTRRRAA